MGYILVSGAASDIGFAICDRLAHEGKRLLLLDVDGVGLAESVAKLPDSVHHLSLEMNLADTGNTCEKLKTVLSGEEITIEGAVFAAGIFSVQPLRMIKHDYFQKSMDIAVFSALQILQVLTSKNVNKDCLKSVVFISSISAKTGTRGYVLYSAVKAAMLGTVHSLAVELAPQVRVNAVLPGGIRTKATKYIYDGMGNVDARSLLGCGQPTDIANIINFLMSDDSRWITGQEFTVDGGTLIN